MVKCTNIIKMYFIMERNLSKLIAPNSFIKILINAIHEYYGHICISKCCKIFKEDFMGEIVAKAIQNELIRCMRYQISKYDTRNHNI